MEHHNLEKDIASDLKEQFELEFGSLRDTFKRDIIRYFLRCITRCITRCIDL